MGNTGSIAVGLRFSPSDEELINFYLKNKNQDKIWLVDDKIGEINICNYEPMLLPRLSKIPSDDLVWYFFSPKEYANGKKTSMKRTTGSGFWKPTGKDRIIKEKRGSKGEIGIKKTLVYHEGKVANGVRTPWVMHEYHITCLPHELTTYVLCKVKYKGEDGLNLYGARLNTEINTVPEVQVEQPGQGNCNSTVQPEAPHIAPIDVEFLSELIHVDGSQVEWLFSDEEFISSPIISTQENCSQYLSKEPVSGIIDDYSSDSDDDAESISELSYQGTSSPGDDSVADSNKHFLQTGEAFISRLTISMQENNNHYMPKEPLSGIIDDYSCDGDDDAKSISELSYQGTLSPGGDSVVNSTRHFIQTDGDKILLTNAKSCNDLQTYGEPSISRMTRGPQLTRRTVPSKQEVKEDTSRAVDTSMNKKSSMVKTEKQFSTEEAIERNCKNPECVYLRNTLIGYILLVGLIGNIKS